METNPSDILIPTEAAKIVRRSVVTLERWRRMRIGPSFYRVCGRVLYSRAEIDRWLVANMERAQ